MDTYVSALDVDVSKVDTCVPTINTNRTNIPWIRHCNDILERTKLGSARRHLRCGLNDSFVDTCVSAVDSSVSTMDTDVSGVYSGDSSVNFFVSTADMWRSRHELVTHVSPPGTADVGLVGRTTISSPSFTRSPFLVSENDLRQTVTETSGFHENQPLFSGNLDQRHNENIHSHEQQTNKKKYKLQAQSEECFKRTG